MRPHSGLLVGLAVLATLTAGCGGEEKSPPTADPSSSQTSTAPTESPSVSPSATTSPSATRPSWTACSKIWVAGNRLPLRYEGCDDAGKPVPANGRPCLVGHELVVYRQRFYAMATGKIFESDNLAADSGYDQMRYLCKNGAPR